MLDIILCTVEPYYNRHLVMVLMDQTKISACNREVTALQSEHSLVQVRYTFGFVWKLA